MSLHRHACAIASTAVLAAAVACGGDDEIAESDALCVDAEGEPLPVADSGDRVDRYVPRFDNDTADDLTNRLFPADAIESALYLGTRGAATSRRETTLIRDDQTIAVDGRTSQVVTVQQVWLTDDRIAEAVTAWYAQDSRGAVWLVGEDVHRYQDGVAVDSSESWRADRGGEAGMVMPPSPDEGDVFRPRDDCARGLFTEQVVRQTDVEIGGPVALVRGAVIMSVLTSANVPGGITFAPDYGELLSSGEGREETLAIAVPKDAVATTVPPSVETLTIGSAVVFDAAGVRDWTAAEMQLDEIVTAWSATRTPVLPLLAQQVDRALAELASAIDARDSSAAQSEALALARAAFDVRLRNEPPETIDRARFDLWLSQVEVDAPADLAGVKSDSAMLEWTWRRIELTFDDATAAQMRTDLNRLQGAAARDDAAAAASIATTMRAGMAGIGWR